MSSEFPTRTSSATSPALRSSDSDHSRFPSGVVVANRYRIVALIGQGGMGEVYRADDLKLGQVVALKFLPLAVASDPSRLVRLFAEARLAREVTHPNVCRVHDVGEVDGQHFLTMEYVDGEDLASLLRRIGHLPRDKGLEIARQICAGLAAAHARGVLHRDLKPSNVMIDGRGRARLTDFGLAITTGEPSGGPIAGTPAYMAPEQRAGEPVTVRSDLYALGLVLFELFTGRPAFLEQADGGQPHEIPPAPSTFVSDLHGSIDRTVMGCLETEPALRPPSALAVAASLPGGDPLAALVAAGETPPPEMVAAAGEKARVSSRFAWPHWRWCSSACLWPSTRSGRSCCSTRCRSRRLPKCWPTARASWRFAWERRPARRGAPTGSGMRTALTTADAGEAPGRSPIVFWYRQGRAPARHHQPAGDRLPARSPAHRARHGDGDRRHAGAPRLASVRGHAGPVGAEAFLGRRPLGRGPRCDTHAARAAVTPASGRRRRAARVGKHPRRSARARRGGQPRRRAQPGWKWEAEDRTGRERGAARSSTYSRWPIS